MCGPQFIPVAILGKGCLIKSLHPLYAFLTLSAVASRRGKVTQSRKLNSAACRRTPDHCPFTDANRTRLALTEGLKLAQDLNVRFQIVVMRAVPYPLPLDKPPVASGFTEKQVVELTKDLTVKPAVRIYDCREPEASLLQILPPASLVVVGCRETWWSSREPKLVRQLRQAGHHVVAVRRS